jgi:ATP adenylyltransferase
MRPPVNRLWAPWRLAYIKGPRPRGCFLCAYAREKKRDRENLVVARSGRAICVINRYPYNNGHLMAAPIRHVGAIEAVTTEEVVEIWGMVRDVKRRLDRAMRPHGYNIGLNLGRLAGAGLPGHLHVHLVPRWGGDTNYMPVVGNTKVLPMSLRELHSVLVAPQRGRTPYQRTRRAR